MPSWPSYVAYCALATPFPPPAEAWPSGPVGALQGHTGRLLERAEVEALDHVDGPDVPGPMPMTTKSVWTRLTRGSTCRGGPSTAWPPPGAGYKLDWQPSGFEILILAATSGWAVPVRGVRI